MFCKKIKELPPLPPSLEFLSCTDCHNLKELPSLPPILRHLNCYECISLTKLPPFPPTLLCVNLTELPPLHPTLQLFCRGCHIFLIIYINDIEMKKYSCRV